MAHVVSEKDRLNFNRMHRTATSASLGDLLDGLANPSASYIDFKVATQTLDHVEGRTFWDPVDHCLAFNTEKEGTTLQIGQEQFILAVNGAGEDISDGTVVYLSGAQGNRPQIKKAIANDKVIASRVIGVTTSDIAKNQEGYVTVSGIVRGYNTFDFDDGAPLYLSPTVAGALTDEMPAPPYHSLIVAYALNSTISGSIFVSVNLGKDLEDLHDVLISSASQPGNLLILDTDNIWKNSNTINIDSGIAGLEVIQSGSGLSGKFGDETNYTEISSSGSFTFYGNAVMEDDLFFPLLSAKQGQTDKPPFSPTEEAYMFPQNDTSHILYITVQFPHAWETGTVIEPHVHWKQTQSASPVFKMDYKWMDIGSQISASATYEMSTGLMTYTSGSIHQLSYNPIPLSGSSISGHSSIMQVKLYRDDNVYVGAVPTYQFDIHIRKDKLGESIQYS